MPKKNKYWRFQIVGWFSFTCIVFFLLFSNTPAILKPPHLLYSTLPLFSVLPLLGIFLSHLIKVLINHLQLLEKPIWKQVLFIIMTNTLCPWILFLLLHISTSLIRMGRFPNFNLKWFTNPLTLIELLSFATAFTIWTLAYYIFQYIKKIRTEEHKKANLKIEMIEMEARALRAQMNPHFIFNCLNSIKSLIQTEEKQKAEEYLIAFSNLIRTLFQNSDKRQISLFEELETCKIYMQLESMRFGNKLHSALIIEPNLDLKSVMVPALIIQPFIENAIWHGIVPKKSIGSVSVTVKQKDEVIICEVDDDGIGRHQSKLRRPEGMATHESRGVHLSTARLNIEKMLSNDKSTIKTLDKFENGKAAGTCVILTFNQPH
ncbi:MAG: histidine kinase [Chitinophagaceae bacterium]|nr:histidine kinase [Chitinophagaceae bacterium]